MKFVIPDGGQIRRERKRQKIRQVDLARRAGISQCMLSRVEKDAVNASSALLRKIVKILWRNDDDEGAKA